MDCFNPAVGSFARQSQSALYRQTGDLPLAKRMSWQTLEDLRLQQASSLAYFDVFWFFAVVAAALVILVFLMKRSVAEKRGRGRRGITGISPPIAIGDLAGFQLALTGTI